MSDSKKTDKHKLAEESLENALKSIEEFICKNNVKHQDIKNEMNFPKLVLMVIGDSTAFVPKHWQTSVFKAGITETIKAARDCLILYEGTNTKVSTLVEEAVNDFHASYNPKTESSKFGDQKQENQNDDKDLCFVHIIGLMPKECRLDDNKSFTIKEGKTKYGYRLSKIIKGISEKWTPLVLLNPTKSTQKHTGFADKPQMSTGWPSDFKEKQQETKENMLYMRVPVVTIVAEGDLKTIRIVHQILKKRLPVLVIKGSGKAADFIADFIEDAKGKTEINKTTIREKAAQFLGIIFHKKDYHQLKKNMTYILRVRFLVKIVSTNEEASASAFTDAVTNAVISSWSRKAQSELQKLQIGSLKPQFENYSWQDIRGKSLTRHAISREPRPLMEKYTSFLKTSTLSLHYYSAYQYINEISSEKDRTEDLQILLREAIIADQTEYTAILLSEGVKFNPAHFYQLYKETILKQFDDTTDFQHILKWGPHHPRQCLRKVYETGDADTDASWKCVISGRQICQSLLSYQKKVYPSKTGKYGDETSINCDLLLWAVLANRPSLATIFWTKSCHQLCACFVSSLYNNMAVHVKSEEPHSHYNEWTEEKKKFEKLALSLQNKLYAEDADTAMELLVKKDTIWDITASPLECAHENLMYDIISHTSSQRQLNRKWYRGIGSSSFAVWKEGFLFGCCCCCKQGIRCGCMFGGNNFKLHSFFNTPLIKFLVHYFFFLIALFCFSAFLLVELDEFSGLASIQSYEWLVYMYFLTDAAEEYRKLFSFYKTSDKMRHDADFFKSKHDSTNILSAIKNGTEDKNRTTTDELQSNKSSEEHETSNENTKQKVLTHSLYYRMIKYLYDVWNFLDVISYILIVVAVFLRFTQLSTVSTKIVRRTYSVALFAMYMKFLRVLLMSKKLGPKIIMIKEMFKDLFRFIGILFVFMMGVGVLYHANMYPKHVDMWSRKGWEYWRIWKIISIPYWQIYGDSYLDAFEDNSTVPCSTIASEWENNPDIERCSQYDPILVIVAALYMLVSNLLLVNLVIALFR